MNSEGAIIETDIHLAGGVRTECRIHFLNSAALVQKRFNILLKLSADSRTAGNGMCIVAVMCPATGLLQIAFVEFTHDFLHQRKQYNERAKPVVARPPHLGGCVLLPALASL